MGGVLVLYYYDMLLKIPQCYIPFLLEITIRGALYDTQSISMIERLSAHGSQHEGG